MGEVETVMGGRVLELPSDKLREERAAGMAEGMTAGKIVNLIQLAQRKLRKGKTAEEIAEDLGEPLENVKRILEAIEDCGE